MLLVFLFVFCYADNMDDYRRLDGTLSNLDVGINEEGEEDDLNASTSNVNGSNNNINNGNSNNSNINNSHNNTQDIRIRDESGRVVTRHSSRSVALGYSNVHEYESNALTYKLVNSGVYLIHAQQSQLDNLKFQNKSNENSNVVTSVSMQAQASHPSQGTVDHTPIQSITETEHRLFERGIRKHPHMLSNLSDIQAAADDLELVSLNNNGIRGGQGDVGVNGVIPPDHKRTKSNSSTKAASVTTIPVRGMPSHIRLEMVDLGIANANDLQTVNNINSMNNNIGRRDEYDSAMDNAVIMRENMNGCFGELGMVLSHRRNKSSKTSMNSLQSIHSLHESSIENGGVSTQRPHHVKQDSRLSYASTAMFPGILSPIPPTPGASTNGKNGENEESVFEFAANGINVTTETNDKDKTGPGPSRQQTNATKTSKTKTTGKNLRRSFGTKKDKNSILSIDNDRARDNCIGKLDSNLSLGIGNELDMLNIQRSDMLERVNTTMADIQIVGSDLSINDLDNDGNVISNNNSNNNNDGDTEIILYRNQIKRRRESARRELIKLDWDKIESVTQQVFKSLETCRNACEEELISCIKYIFDVSKLVYWRWVLDFLLRKLILKNSIKARYKRVFLLVRLYTWTYE